MSCSTSAVMENTRKGSIVVAFLLVLFANFAQGANLTTAKNDEANSTRNPTANSTTQPTAKPTNDPSRNSSNKTRTHIENLQKLLLDTIGDKDQYDKRIRPFAGGPPLEIYVFLTISSLREVSEDAMSYTTSMYFREYWQDPRLTFNAADYGNATETTLSGSVAGDIWVPDTYVANSIDSTNPEEAKMISHQSFVRFQNTGHVLRSRRVSMNVECSMDIQYHPFDEQACTLQIESCKLSKLALGFFPTKFQQFVDVFDSFAMSHPANYLVTDTGTCSATRLSKNRWHRLQWKFDKHTVGRPEELVLYHWKMVFDNGKSPVRVNDRIQIPEFSLDRVFTKNVTSWRVTGNFSRLVACFIFSRNPGFYLAQFLVPSAVLTASAWILLWLERESSMSDMMCVVLATLFLYFSYNSVMPKVSYVTAMNAYILACFLFIFCALLAMALVRHLRIGEKRLVQEEEAEDSANGGAAVFYLLAPNAKPPPNGPRAVAEKAKPQSDAARASATKIQLVKRVALIAYPVLFAIFNIVFFIGYLSAPARHAARNMKC